jgi:hypothetical protein
LVCLTSNFFRSLLMLLRRTCQEVAALLVAREDRALGAADRVAMRLHMLACQACPRFERQILTMRNAMKQWRAYSNDDSGSNSGDSPHP